MVTHFTVLFLEQVFYKLTIVFGVVFLDYLLMLSLRDCLQPYPWVKTWQYHRLIQLLWVALLALNLFFLQQLLVLTHHTSNEFNIFWNNTDLQIMVLFYFLYMLDDPLMIYTTEGIAIGLACSYYWNYGIASHLNIFTMGLALLLIFICSYHIHSKQKSWIDHPLIYILSELGFSGSWALLLSPTMGHASKESIMFMFNFVFIMFVIHLVNILVRKRVRDYSRLTQNVKLDYLTGIGNRGAFDQALEEAFPIFKKQSLPLCFAMCDIDHFKRINDRYGHLFGDEVIRTVAQTSKQLLDQLGTHGQIFRLGGEEFGIIFRNKTSDYAQEIMVEICQAIYEAPFESHGEQVHISFSVGISALKCEDLQPKAFYQRVDHYLYHAKSQGRKSITCEGERYSYL